MDIAARLSAVLAAAQCQCEATEGFQIGDIYWLWDELDGLKLPSDQHAAWRRRIDALDYKVHHLVDQLAKVLISGRAAASDQECDSLETQIAAIEQRQSELFDAIEVLELHLVLEFPKILSGRYEPVPPHLKDLSQIIKSARELWWHLGSSEPAPCGLLDLATALGGLSRQCSVNGNLEQATRAAVTAVALLRRLVRAQPQTLKSKLGKALIVLAQSHLESADVEDARSAAAEACGLVELDAVPPEILGLVADAS